MFEKAGRVWQAVMNKESLGSEQSRADTQGKKIAMEAQETLLIFRRHHRIFLIANFIFFFFLDFSKLGERPGSWNQCWQYNLTNTGQFSAPTLCKAAVGETHPWYTLSEKNKICIRRRVELLGLKLYEMLITVFFLIFNILVCSTFFGSEIILTIIKWKEKYSIHHLSSWSLADILLDL